MEQDRTKVRSVEFPEPVPAPDFTLPERVELPEWLDPNRPNRPEPEPVPARRRRG